MINPNINKLVLVEVKGDKAVYKGHTLNVISFKIPVKDGKRRLYLKYSIFNNQYYLTKDQ